MTTSPEAFCSALFPLVIIKLAGQVPEGETLTFDRSIFAALRNPG